MGKGSARRKEDKQKINDNWDLIWGKKDKEQQTDINEADKEPEKEESSKTK